MVGKPLVPKLRFTEFRQSGPWDVLNGDHLFDTVDRRPAPFGLPVLAITQEQGAISRDDIDYHVSVTAASIASYKEVRPTDFIISLRSFQGGIEYSRVHGICSPAYVILKRKGDGSDDFYRHLFKSPRFIQQITRNIEGIRDGKMISYKQFSEQLLPAPSPPEQQKIAECLTTLDELIVAEGRKLEVLRTHKKGLMQNLFPREGETVPCLRFPGFDDEGTSRAVTLEQVVEVASGQVDPRQPPFCDLPHVGGENIESHTGRIWGIKTARELQLISGKYAFGKKDILYSKIRPVLNKVAAPDFEGICSADIYPIRPATGELSRAYLFYVFQSEAFQTYVTKQSDRGKIPKINREALLAYRLLIPHLPEQQRIAECLGFVDALSTAQAKEIDALKTHKQGLMQALFPSPED